MPVLDATQTIFFQDGSKANLIAVPSGQTITVFSNGNTLYYDNSSAVTSSSNDGNIASGASTTFTTPQYVICAQGAATQVTVLGAETLAAGGAVTGSNLLSGTTSPKSGAVGYGTGAGHAQAGAFYTNTSNGVVYVNENTTASPYWTPVSYVQPDLFGIHVDFRDQVGEPVADTDAEAILAASGLRVFGQGLAETDSGLVAQTAGEGGVVARLTSTDEDAHLAAIGTEAGVFQADQHGTMVVDAELTNVSAITTRAIFLGFSDTAADALDPLMTYATTTITFAQDDTVGLTFSSELTDNDKWFSVAEKTNTAGTQPTTTGDTGTDVAAAGTYQRLRVEVDTDGTARAFIDKGFEGVISGPTGAGAHSATTVAVDPTEEFAPVLYIESTSAATKSIDIRRFAAWGSRI